jgi:hypothetical protein
LESNEGEMRIVPRVQGTHGQSCRVHNVGRMLLRAVLFFNSVNDVGMPHNLSAKSVRVRG